MRRHAIHKAITTVLLLILTGLAGVVPGLADPPVEPGGQSIRLVALGDLIYHMPIVKWAKHCGGDKYDFRPIFGAIKPWLEEADFSVAVLETVLGGEADRGFTGYPMFNTPDEAVDALQWAGVDLVFTAHNHALDRGEKGVLRTIGVLDAKQMLHVGMNASPDPAARVRIVNIKGITLAFLAYTTATNGIPTPKGKPWLVNSFAHDLVREDIRTARSLGADGIVCALHAGAEYRREPDDEQRAAVRFLLDNGVDIVLGSHPHAVQPIAFATLPGFGGDGPPRVGFVAYSLGNCLSNQQWRYSDCGLTVALTVGKQPGGSGIMIRRVETQPLWVWRFKEGGLFGYKILLVGPAGVNPAEAVLNEEEKARVAQVWQDTMETLGYYGTQPQQ